MSEKISQITIRQIDKWTAKWHFLFQHGDLLLKAFKVTEMKNQNLNVPLFLLLDYHHPPSFFLCFFYFSVFFCLCIVSLIGRQTACKCSNPEKSPGAVLIGCALQHCSQSIRARWAPVNSFSLLLLWLWYCHIDSSIDLNPSATVLSLSLSFSVFILSFSKPPEYFFS